MTDVVEKVWLCPKDGTAMESRGRWRGAWRCPECRGLFLDAEAMRRGRAGQPPMWAPFVMSLLMSVVVTMLVRRLRHRPKTSVHRTVGVA